MHTVAVLALEHVVPFDLAVPVEVFGRARLPGGRPAYRVLVCGATGDVDAGTFAIRVRHGLEALAVADTVIVPGVSEEGVREAGVREAGIGPAGAVGVSRPVGASGPVGDPVLEALREAAGRGARIASVCAGAFTLAAAGLLDGLRATTHWLGTSELAARYPAIDVDPDVLFVDNGQILTSAGAAAGLDLCLHLVRRDHGAAVAADAARLSVMPLERDGGQAQFIAYEPPAPDGTSLRPLLAWAEENLHRPLTLDDLARRAALSNRTLSRRFREQTGTTPLQWLNRVRLRRAQQLLETTGQPVERIASQVGFTAASTFRDRFKRLVGVSPAAYRRSFPG
ncbi:GlxA family transcriptional regulator [Cryptosporangium sp. NPDC051539]|uniref:GlxA family transcriptional regulator n=1 Tax=Cryptosporangium sp. NPDC051539 TaxID=3363962 RepID=UPI0037B8CBD1